METAVKTLREQYIIDRFKSVNDKSRHVTRVLISEAVDEERLERTIEVLNKLQSIDFSDMQYFEDATGAIVSDVNSALAGNPKKSIGKRIKFIDRVKETIKGKINDPIINALAALSTLESGFTAAGRLIQVSVPSSLIKKRPKDELLSTQVKLLLGKSANSVQAAIAKSFEPASAFSRMTGMKTQYIDSKKAASAILNAKLSDVIGAIKTLKSGPRAEDVFEAESSGERQADAKGEESLRASTVKLDPDARDELVSKIAGSTDTASKDVEKVIDALATRGMLKLRQ